jgi:hypothetical protein
MQAATGTLTKTEHTGTWEVDALAHTLSTLLLKRLWIWHKPDYTMNGYISTISTYTHVHMCHHACHYNII